MRPAAGQAPDRPRARKRGRWSTAELLEVAERYIEVGERRLAQLLGRSPDSVRASVVRWFSALPMREGAWTDADWHKLRLLFGAHPLAHVALVLRRPLTDVAARVAELRARRVSGPWPPVEIALLKRLHGSRDDADLAVVFGRPAAAVADKAAQLCLRKDKGFLARRGARRPTRMPRWRADQLAMLRRLYPDHDNTWIAQQLARSVVSVVSKAHALGLAKSAARLAAMGRANVGTRWGRHA